MLPIRGTLTPSAADITGLLQAWSDGDAAAADALFPVVYAELHRRAASRMRGESAGHTLQATALVNEAFLRLIDQKRGWRNRAQFLALASRMMRRILVDHARRRRMTKRSGQWVRVAIDAVDVPAGPRGIDVRSLDDALGRLAAFDPRKSHIAELRFFGGLTLEETALVVGISVSTAQREWRAARAWLHAQLTADGQP